MVVVSVLIPTFNRPAELANTLRLLEHQTFKHFEIVVIDDGSPNEDTLKVVEQYPKVCFERLEPNVGVVEAHNIGLQKCKGRYILNLDDDSWPVDSGAIAKCVEFMDAHPEVGIAALNIKNINPPGASLLWPQDLQPFFVPFYVGCGAIYRTEVVLAAGLNVSAFFRQGQESDRSLRVLNSGYQIVALPNILIHHLQSPANRNWKKHTALEAVNYMRRELIRAPLALIPIGILRAAIFALGRIRHMDMMIYLTEMTRSDTKPSRIISIYRQPVKISSYLRWTFMCLLYNKRWIISLSDYANLFNLASGESPKKLLPDNANGSLRVPSKEST
jgi:GT2 family glycosyltransferase